jgi:hypothetical protein
LGALAASASRRATGHSSLNSRKSWKRVPQYGHHLGTAEESEYQSRVYSMAGETRN